MVGIHKLEKCVSQLIHPETCITKCPHPGKWAQSWCRFQWWEWRVKPCDLKQDEVGSLRSWLGKASGILISSSLAIVNWISGNGARNQEFNSRLCIPERPACVALVKLHSPRMPPVEGNSKPTLSVLYKPWKWFIIDLAAHHYWLATVSHMNEEEQGGINS